jgi:GNAT superfamily N-acetyltransferase
MPRYAEFADAAGHHYVEHDMPDDVAYKHPLRSYGDARRLSVYDPADTTKRRIDTKSGIVNDAEKGEPGLIGHADFYREEPSAGITWVSKDKEGNEVRTKSNPIADTNIGYMSVADSHRGGGIGRQMFDYMHKTTPEGSRLNVGIAGHDATEHMARKAQAEKPGSVSWKMF